jgi:GH24 family phage-related lysozyme (muramidase)
MSIFRNTLQPTVQAQLKARQNALKLRTPDAIIHANSRNSWIRMTSSVNVEGKDTLANQYILQGGVLLNGVLGRIPRSGVGNQAYAYSNESPSGKSYNDPNRKAGTAGVKPMPGIKSIDIKSKSAYGSLREVTVNFTCHNLQQLEDLELLYMRPGYTVLIEWGWASYLNKDGKIENNVKFYDGVLKGGKTREEVWREIYNLSVEQEHNYDAMYGYVKNYNWTARMDGGYECTTTIISIGEIMESLKIGYLPFDIDGAATNNLGDNSELSQRPETIEKTKNFYSKNKLAGLCKNLYDICVAKKDPFNDNGNHFTFTPSKSISGIPYNMFAFNYLLSNNDLKDEFLNGSIQGYITLESFIDMLNSYILLHAGKDESNSTPIITLSTKTNTYEVPNLIAEPLLCLAHPLQVSVDPTVCLITSNLWAKGISFDKVNEGAENGTPSLYDAQALEIYNQLEATGQLTSENPIGRRVLQHILYNTSNYNENNAKEFLRSFFKVATQQEKLEYSIKNISYVANKFYRLSNNFKLDYSTSSLITTANQELKENVAADNRRNIQIEFEKSETFRILTQPQVYMKKNLEEEFKKEKDAKDIADTSAAKVKAGYTPFGVPYLTNFQTNNSNIFENGNETGKIGNIYLNINFLYRMSVEPSILDSKTKDLKLYDYLHKVLKEVQESIGGVNNFDIHVDPIDNKPRIIDLNYIDILSKSDAYDKAFPIEAQNLSGTVRSYNLQSKIFPEQGAMIAIGAQVKSSNVQGTSVNTLLDFNNGLEDRIIPKKIEPSVSEVNELADATAKYEKLKNNINKIKDFLFPKPKTVTDTTKPSNDQSLASEYKNSLKDLIIYFQEVIKSNTNGRSIIPVQISLTMDGIGGLVIGHLFKIPPDLLPRGYGSDTIGGKLIQTITEISHKVENGDWTTTIGALNIVTRDSFTENKLNFNDLLTESKTGEFKVKTPLIANQTGPWAERAFNVIVNFEGFKDKAELDTGTPRILRGGYGSPVKLIDGKLVTINANTTFTREEAKATLIELIATDYGPKTIRAIGIPIWDKLTPNQRAALVSYVYNAGPGALSYSGITKSLQEGKLDLAAQQIANGPINTGGVKSDGLISRRKQESTLFLSS